MVSDEQQMTNTALVKQNSVQFIGKILLVGGMALMLVGVGWGSLMVVRASPDAVKPNFQIGVQACPTDLAIGFTPINPEPGQTVQFEALFSSSSGAGQITFTWHFGDGSTEATGQVVNHTYLVNGVYQVTLTATGDTCAPQPAPVTHLITVGFGTPAAIIYLPLVSKNYPEIVFPTGRRRLESE